MSGQLRGDFRCFCGLVGFRFGALVRNNFVGFVGFYVGIALWFGWLFWVICCFGFTWDSCLYGGVV